MGGVIGGLIPFVLNYNRTEAASVNDATYIGFMVFIYEYRHFSNAGYLAAE